MSAIPVIDNWGDGRGNKDSVRHVLFARRDGKAIHTYLCLPGWDSKREVGGLCILKGIDLGVITRQTRIIGYEKDPVLAQKIKQYLQRTLPKYDITIRDKNLTECKLDPSSVDFAFLDFKGVINSKLHRWMVDTLLPGLTCDATLAITQNGSRQLGTLFHQVDDFLTSRPDEREEFIRQYFITPPTNAAIVTQLFQLKSLLRDYYTECWIKHNYHDGQHISMSVFLFERIRPRRSSDHPVEEFILSCPKPGAKQPQPLPRCHSFKKGEPMTTRTKAAKKAHATRRANALFAKRSAAAHKAWRTRRAQA